MENNKFKAKALFKIGGRITLYIGIEGERSDVEMFVGIYKKFIERVYGQNYELVIK